MTIAVGVTIAEPSACFHSSPIFLVPYSIWKSPDTALRDWMTRDTRLYRCPARMPAESRNVGSIDMLSDRNSRNSVGVTAEPHVDSTPTPSCASRPAPLGIVVSLLRVGGVLTAVDLPGGLGPRADGVGHVFALDQFGAFRPDQVVVVVVGEHHPGHLDRGFAVHSE